MTHVLFAWRRYTGAFYQDARPARPTPPSSPAQLQALLKAGRRNQLDADAPLPEQPGNRAISHTDITANFFIDNRYSAVDADPGKDGCFSVVPSWPSSEFSLVAREGCEFLQLKLHRMKPRGSRYPTKRWENAWLARIEPEAVCSDLRGSVHQGPLERQEPTRFKGWGISMRRGRQTGAPGLRRSLGLCSGQRLQRQVGALVGNALNLPCRVAEQLMRQVGQGPRGRDLLPDLRDLLVIRITAGQAVADHASAVPGQPRLGPRLPVFLVE